MRAIQHGTPFGDKLPNKKDRLQYYDDVRPYTMVVDLEEYGFWKDLITQTEFAKIFDIDFSLDVGLALVNPIDQFNRKVGLATAIKSMKKVSVKLKEIQIQSSGDLELEFDLAGHPLHILIGSRGNRVIITRDYSYRVLDLYNSIFGR